MSMTTRHFGVFSLAAWTMNRPRGPAPAMTTTSENWMSPRLTAWIEQDSGSMTAASSNDTVSGILWMMARAERRMYSAMPPSATSFWKP